MGSLVTKMTTNNIELNESNASDIVHYEVIKEIEFVCFANLKTFFFVILFSPFFHAGRKRKNSNRFRTNSNKDRNAEKYV